MTETIKHKAVQPFDLVTFDRFGVSLIKTTEDDSVTYSGLLFLENDQGHRFGIQTDIEDTCPHCAAKRTMMVGLGITDDFYIAIDVIEPGGDIIKDALEFDAADLYDELEDEVNERHNFSNEDLSSDRVLH